MRNKNGKKKPEDSVTLNSDGEEVITEKNPFGLDDSEATIHVEGKATTALPQVGAPSEFDHILDEKNKIPEIEVVTEESLENLSEKELKKRAKKQAKAKKRQEKMEADIAAAKADLEKPDNEVGLDPEQEARIQKTNAEVDRNVDKAQAKHLMQAVDGEAPSTESIAVDESVKEHWQDAFANNAGLHYIDGYTIDIDKIEPVNLKSKKYHKNTNLYVNTRIYNRFIDYNPSDFTPAQIRDLFIDIDTMHLPNDSGFKLKLYPNDNEKTLRVEVYVSRFYSYGQVVENRKAFAPFWITGFGEPILYASTMRPIEKNYRVNETNTFAYRETTKILRKKIASKYINLSRDKFATEQDFKEAQALKNSYIEHHIERLNMISTLEWECVPDLYVDWKNKRVVIKLYLKVISTVDYTRLPYMFYVDSFNVNLNDLLDISKQQATSFDDNPRHKKVSRTLIDINTICYLIALNAMYKNILVFSYNTLYECYKSIAFQVLKKGYDLKQITPGNLSTLKIVDFTKHYVCQKRMFDDRLLHLMNLKSAHEEYYQMKFMYSAQKNPRLLYSEYIVKEFEKVQVNELALLLRNEEERAWRKRLESLKAVDANDSAWDKDFYINNYNIFDYSKHSFSNVEDYLMNVIKEDKDEIARISALGREVLSVDQKQFFTKKELREMQKTARRLNRLEVKEQ